MVDKADPQAEYRQAIEDSAQRLAEQFASATEVDWQVGERAMEIARQKRLANSSETKAGDYHKRLTQMSASEFNRRSNFNDWEL